MSALIRSMPQSLAPLILFTSPPPNPITFVNIIIVVVIVLVAVIVNMHFIRFCFTSTK